MTLKAKDFTLKVKYLILKAMDLTHVYYIILHITTILCLLAIWHTFVN